MKHVTGVVFTLALGVLAMFGFRPGNQIFSSPPYDRNVIYSSKDHTIVNGDEWYDVLPDAEYRTALYIQRITLEWWVPVAKSGSIELAEVIPGKQDLAVFYFMRRYIHEEPAQLDWWKFQFPLGWEALPGAPYQVTLGNRVRVRYHGSNSANGLTIGVAFYR